MSTFLLWLKSVSLTALLPAVIVVVIGILAIRLLMKILKAAFNKTHLDPAFSKLLLGVVKPVLYVILGLIAATSLGIDVTSIVALASVLTLAISLALQNALANIFGGFTLLYTKPFTTDDYVEIAGQSGTVKEVGLAYTRLATADNKLVFIPNSAVVAAEIVNYTVTGTRRVGITVSASYDADPDLVIATLLEAAQLPGVLQDPAPSANVSEYGDSSISYALRVWTKTEDFWDVQFAINRRLYSIFKEKGVEMTYPHLNVHMMK